ISRMAADKNPDLFWNCGALTPPESPASIVNDAERRHLLRNVQPDKASHHEPPNVRITGQSFPDRGTIGRSSADRDYRMSTVSRCNTHAIGIAWRILPMRKATAFGPGINNKRQQQQVLRGAVQQGASVVHGAAGLKQFPIGADVGPALPVPAEV